MVDTDQNKKYLIIGSSWVGDMVMAQSLFSDIKLREPRAQIDVFAPAWTAVLQKPLIAVYGSTDSGYTSLLSDNHRVARLNLPCSPYFKRDCPLTHLDCLNKLPLSTVLELAQTFYDAEVS